MERNRTSHAESSSAQHARTLSDEHSTLLESLSALAPSRAGAPGRHAEPAPKPVQRDLSLALDLIKHAPEIIEGFEKRAEEMEARIEALLESAGQELRAAEARIRQAEQRAREAEARAKAAQDRLDHAEEWIARFTAAIESSFATLRPVPEHERSGTGSPLT